MMDSTSTAYSELKRMEKGQSMFFPYDTWGNVRAVASQMKKTFGCRFRVHKTGKRTENGPIKVIRLE